MATVAELRAVAKARGVKGYGKMKKAELEKAVGPANVPVDAAVEGIHANVRRLKSMHGLTAEHVTRIAAVKKAIDDLEKHIDKLEGNGREKRPSPSSTLPPIKKNHLSVYFDKRFHPDFDLLREQKRQRAEMREERKWGAEWYRKKELEKKIQRLRMLRIPGGVRS